ncbi:MAG: heavy-metal-associated domain-containing protein [Bacteroidetes bacterium]|nr:heavy-metal-associated domain-containing protein [Bacteroidota bacterium]
MKTLILIPVTAAIVFCSYQNLFSQCHGGGTSGTQSSSHKHETTAETLPAGTVDSLTKSVFRVYGNCGMCKSRIEKSLTVDGVGSANWNSDTKMIEVRYDAAKISQDKIHSLIASAGYDTDLVKAKDEAYNNLPMCCQYERPGTMKEKKEKKEQQQDDVYEHQH